MLDLLDNFHSVVISLLFPTLPFFLKCVHIYFITLPPFPTGAGLCNVFAHSTLTRPFTCTLSTFHLCLELSCALAWYQEQSTMASVATKLAREKAALEGLGSNANAVKYLKQDFEALRRQCLQSGTLFKDEEFPACPSALGYRDLGPYSPKTQGIIWKRPPVSIYC